MTGELIKHCTELQDVGVAQLCQHLDEGIYEKYGVPRSGTSFYHALIYENVQLRDGQKFSDYGIPHNATINVVRRFLDEVV